MQSGFQYGLLGMALFMMGGLLATVPGSAQTEINAAPGSVSVPASDTNLLYFGRWDRSDPRVAHSHWGGAYLRARFTGTSVGLKMADRQPLAVSIDGEPFRPVEGKAGITPLNIAPLSAGLHTVLVGPSMGGEAKVLGLTLALGAALKPALTRPIIEFIGDSITWGTGPEGMWNVNHTWQTAEALGCDHTQVAQSARALTTGYGCADEKTGMDTQYFRLKNFGYVHDRPQVPWDFSVYTPQVIVINLGQNDACGSEPDDIFTASYIRFLKHLRVTFPKAQIVALRMFGGGHFGEDTQKAVVAVHAGGDTRVHFLDTAGWLDQADYADGVHPNASGNLKIALRLAPWLKPLLPGKAEAMTVGDPANPTGLAQAIQNAYIRGERHIVVTPGTYLLANKGAAQITLDGWRDAVLSAYGVTLILDNRRANNRVFLLNHCVGVTLAGPLLSQTAQTAYQGRVTAFAKDESGAPTCDWRPSAGYPVPPADTKELWINVVDAKTRTLDIRAGDYYHAPIAPPVGGVYRIGLENRPVKFAVGDWIVARYGDPPNKVFLADCRECTIKDVTLMRNGFAPIFESEGGGNHFLSCHWALGPRPAGAVENPVVTNAADGLHSPDADPGPDIENCTFEGVFLDDCIAIHGGFHQIVRGNGPVITAQNGYAFYTVGEPVRLSNDKGFYLQANVTALKDNGDGTSTLTLDTAVTIPADARLSSPLHDGHGYKIIGCRLGNTRSRGIIVKSDDGIIRDNIISHCGLAIRIGPEWPDEADYSQNVVVAGNTLTQNGDGIVIDGSGAKQNRNITIENNRLLSNTGTDLSVAWADGVTITGNTFADHFASPSAISVRDSQNVRIHANKIKTPSVAALPFVHVGPNVTQLTQDSGTAGP